MLLTPGLIPGMETAGTMQAIFHRISTAGTVRITIHITILIIVLTGILVHGQIHIIVPDGPVRSVTTGDPAITMVGEIWATPLEILTITIPGVLLMVMGMVTDTTITTLQQLS